MARPGPRSVRKYSDEFKLSAVRLSQQPGIQVRTVAASLAIHPVMLSKWRKDVRDGRLTGHARKAPGAPPTRELARLQQLERDYALLQEWEGAQGKTRDAPAGPAVGRAMLLCRKPLGFRQPFPFARRRAAGVASPRH